jgi:hypothetical protein
LIIVDDLSHDGALRKMQGGLISELWTTARHYGISLSCNVHSIYSLGSLARRQASAFPIANYKATESIREMYGQLAGSLNKFDALMDEAIGPNSEPHPFLCVKADSKSVNRMFLLRFDALLEQVDSDSD